MNQIIHNVIESGTIEYGDAVIVGFSGGPDSLTLLHAINSIKSTYDLSLVAIHINHMLRPVVCDEEAAHAEAICKELGVPCRLLRIDCGEVAKRRKFSAEEAGRLIRYEAYERLATSLEDEGFEPDQIKIAVAQNRDDQVETVLFHILRGTGIHGLTGIPVERYDSSGHRVVRPLLTTSRADIEQYIADNGLQPNYDESNEQPIYSRNKIRLELLPLLENEYNPAVKRAIVRLGELAAADDDFILEQAMQIYDAMNIAPNRFLIMQELGLHVAIKRRVAVMMLEELNIKPTYELVNATVGLLDSTKPSASCNLPDGWTADRKYELIEFHNTEHRNNIEGDSDEISEGNITGERADGACGILSLKATMLTKDEYLKRVIKAKEHDEIPKSEAAATHETCDSREVVSKPFAAFDLDEIMSARGLALDEIDGGDIADNLNLKLRSRRSGDYIAVLNGSKKLQDFLVDEKVPRMERDEIKIAVIGSEILWILPDDRYKSKRYRTKGKYSQKYQICNNSRRVLFLELV